MSEEKERPDFVTEEHLEFLDKLRESGVTNMFNSGTYLQREFRLSLTEARKVVVYWMETFSERHQKES